MGEFQQRDRQAAKVRRAPPAEISDLVSQGRKFIPVDRDFDARYIPKGYSKLKMKYNGDVFIALVPKYMLGIIANEGEGDNGKAMDALADLCHEIEQYEDGLMLEGMTNAMEAHLGTIVTNNYEVRSLNELAKPGMKADGSTDVDNPVYDDERLKQLDLDDPYVLQRVKAIAAIMLGKDASELDEAELADIVDHKTVMGNFREKMSVEELSEVTCYAGSHYELKPEYKGTSGNPFEGEKDGMKININRTMSEHNLAGVKSVDRIERPVIEATTQQLLDEISAYRMQKREGAAGQQGENEVEHRTERTESTPTQALAPVGRHDQQLIMQYINARYIAADNPNARLNIHPPKKI